MLTPSIPLSAHTSRTTIQSAECFGEEVLWSDRPAVFTAGALTYADLQVIDRKALFPILDAFPAFRRNRFEKLVRVRVLREKLRLFVAAVGRTERRCAVCGVAKGGLAFTEVALAAVPPIVLWEMEMQNRGSEQAVPFRAHPSVESLSGGEAGRGAAPAGTTEMSPAARAVRDQRLIERLQAATSPFLDGDPDSDDGGSGSGSRFTMEAVILCVSKAVPEYFERASRAAVTVQRVFRGYSCRLAVVRKRGGGALGLTTCSGDGGGGGLLVSAAVRERSAEVCSCLRAASLCAGADDRRGAQAELAPEGDIQVRLSAGPPGLITIEPSQHLRLARTAADRLPPLFPAAGGTSGTGAWTLGRSSWR